jgi:adenylate cyclase
VYRLFLSWRERLLFRTALGRYFPRSLAERIAAEGKTELAPGHKELTMLFADIAGFTKWSSDKEPETVHAFLTDYLENMAGILFENGGTVDKFMGDGLLAFFGDPLEQKDHASRCLRAAIAMQKRVAALGEKWGPKIGINLRIRIGINSGKVIVGNLGTKTRIEYTVIGSAVNLAQRMESGAPIGGILVAGPARALAGDEFSFSEKREVTVKGYDAPVEAFELLF